MQASFHHRARFSGVLALAFAFVATTGVAQAQCPRGQIFWKSKNSCIDKAEAAKLGFYHGPLPKTDAPSAAAPADAPPAAQTGPGEAAPAQATPQDIAPNEPVQAAPAPKPAVAPRAAPSRKPTPPAAVDNFSAPLVPPPGFQPPAKPEVAAPVAERKSPYGELVIEDFSHGK